MRCFSQMRIGIIGAGSIGLLLSSYLSERHEVTIYVRRGEQKDVLNNQGLFLSDNGTPISVQALLLEEIQEADIFIVCVKQYQIVDVLSTLKRQTPLLFLQNGMGHISQLERIDNDIYIGVTDHGALRKSDNYVIHTGKGAIKIAKYNDDANKVSVLAQQLNKPNFPVETAQDWRNLLAQKLVVNAVINPLTTLFNVYNREILNNQSIFHLAKKLCDEAATALQLDYKTHLRKIKEVAYQTSGNMSSMLMDIKAGRQTEIDAISGYLIKNSRHEMPYTTFVYHSIKALETKNENGTYNG